MVVGDTLTIVGVPILFNHNYLKLLNLRWRAVAHGYLVNVQNGVARAVPVLDI